MDAISLTPDQERYAEQLYLGLPQTYLDEARRLARLLASKPDDQLLGKTEVELRDAMPRLGVMTLHDRCK